MAEEKMVTKEDVLSYIQNLSSADDKDDIEFEVIDFLLGRGADITACSWETGQCIMHEVAARWDKEVADFFLKKGADIHKKDKDGRTPLHIAASSNHVEMMEWLVEHCVHLEAQTDKERQTPFHYAVRYNSVEALKFLYDKGADYEVQDYNGRTPLHLAAELDRTAAAECLISLPIPAEVRVKDNLGNVAIASMIRTMPRVASMALDQLHKIDAPKRKQFYILSHLEPEIDNQDQGVKTPFEVAVEEKQRQVLTHPVMQVLITEKWTYIRWCFYSHLALNFVFLISWSVLIAHPSVQDKHVYTFPRDTWRIIVEAIALILYLFLIFQEVLAVIRSVTKHRFYKKCLGKMIQDDLNTFTHLEEERKYLETKLAYLEKLLPEYFRDPWHITDTVSIVLILFVIILHAADVAAHTHALASWVARISCFALIVMWIRLFKLARGFRTFGPLIAIIGELIGDILRYFALYSIIFIPYVICFWVLFGGQQSAALSDTDREDLSSFYRVAIMTFRISLIDDYLYSGMRSIDEAMATILVTTTLILLAIVGLNLFIALLSHTFQRVYDNAQANSLLEQASLIRYYEENLCSCVHRLYLKHIHTECNPRTKYYDDDEELVQDGPAELKKITRRINDIALELSEKISADLDEIHSKFSGKVDQLDAKIAQTVVQLEAIQSLLQRKDVPVLQPLLASHGSKEPSFQSSTPQGVPTTATPVSGYPVGSQTWNRIHGYPLPTGKQPPPNIHSGIQSHSTSPVHFPPARTSPGWCNLAGRRQEANQQALTIQQALAIQQQATNHRRVQKNVSIRDLMQEIQWKKKLQPYNAKIPPEK